MKISELEDAYAGRRALLQQANTKGCLLCLELIILMESSSEHRTRDAQDGNDEDRSQVVDSRESQKKRLRALREQAGEIGNGWAAGRASSGSCCGVRAGKTKCFRAAVCGCFDGGSKERGGVRAAGMRCRKKPKTPIANAISVAIGTALRTDDENDRRRNRRPGGNEFIVRG